MACLVAEPIEIAFHQQQQQRQLELEQQQRQLELEQQQELQGRQSQSLQSAMLARGDARAQQLYAYDPHGQPPCFPTGPFNED